MKPCKQLTYEQRCQIYVLKNSNLTQQRLMIQLALSQSAASRESRVQTQRGYRYQQAQHKSEARCSAATKTLKITPGMIALIESKLNLKWSPEQIAGWLLTERCEQLSTETIYQHIWADKAAGGSLYFS